MAQSVKTVYTVEHFKLLDGTELEVKPLPIRRLRKANDLINTALAGSPVLDEDGEPLLDSDGDPRTETKDDDVIDAFIDVVLIVMQGQPKCENFLDGDEGREELEDVMDQHTLFAIIKAATGFDFLEMQKRLQALMERGLPQ